MILLLIGLSGCGVLTTTTVVTDQAVADTVLANSDRVRKVVDTSWTTTIVRKVTVKYIRK